MSKARAGAGVMVRHVGVAVEVPTGCTQEQEDALIVRALHLLASERFGGVPSAVVPAARRGGYPAGPPSPGGCATEWEFLDRMRALKKWAGVSYERLEKGAARDADGSPLLPHSTLQRMLSESNIDRLPTQEQLAEFVMGCGLSKEQWREWSQAWADIRLTPRPEPAPDYGKNLVLSAIRWRASSAAANRGAEELARGAQRLIQRAEIRSLRHPGAA